MIYVIGSGPSGVACARQLLKKGFSVTMLDAGLRLEDEREKVVRCVRENDHTLWTEDFLADYKAGFQVDHRGVECKPAYGSLFPYRDISSFHSVYKNVKATPSYARGGLSNVWGSSSLAYLPEDISSWPVTAEDLKPYYEAVFSFLPIAKDPGSPAIPESVEVKDFREFKMSRQVSGLTERLRRGSQGSEAKKVFLGGSKLSVDTLSNGPKEKECIYCGLCMYGCPFSLIYNSASTLEDLQKDKGFIYKPGALVEYLEEKEGEVRIHFREISSGLLRMLPAEKVFLATGVFSTARILLRSYNAYDKPLTCLDSQYFLLPLIGFWGTKASDLEHVHTLAQLCLWTLKSDLKKAAFLQIYGYNDLYEKEIRSLTGFAFPVLRGAVQAILERLFMVQGFLHSDDSARIRIELKRNARGGEEFHLEGITNPETAKALREMKREISSFCNKAMLFPVTPMMEIGAPGRGYHSGGTFPMSVSPHYGESDLLGRPHGFKNVHCVDASVFPTIPAGPITINVMANASRIANQAFSK